MRLTGFFVLDPFRFRCYGLGMGKKRRQLSNYLYQGSGLNVVSILLSPGVFYLIPDIEGLIEAEVLLQPVRDRIQSDISECPYLVKRQGDSDRGIVMLGGQDIRCSGLVGSLRRHVQDRGGSPALVGPPMIKFNQAHGELVRLGFSATVYHPWATRCGIEGYRPPPKNVIDSL